MPPAPRVIGVHQRPSRHGFAQHLGYPVHRDPPHRLGDKGPAEDRREGLGHLVGKSLRLEGQNLFKERPDGIAVGRRPALDRFVEDETQAEVVT